ncbi:MULTISPECIES: electron transport complex subunit RsxE [Tissierella]|uniref:Ion-translocating oxidoreductase complex subunit E n=1 Tax=Tissierella praeacuta DSM 18095 TaxID=1123404 RepID=A0A1M4S695_9FIRM|nr:MULTISPECIES: electron transport complex subunit E [Tissierella]MBU5256732.1 electron transport complex subunit E [Tissierella praeacuta]TCU71643.1 electron transport complex protein RnfE [Tissierella praeacuta]SHE27722.1 electron transport complex protein RnfE [Tissierella praeacuta DSM 18095]SUP00965.1 Na(+)-translocating NADH-quinone reductase subunit D [Tissierella praeacuta]
MKLSKIFKNGIVNDNPTFVQLIGMCSTLAVSTSVENSIAMGLAVIAVLVGSNLVISLLRNVIPNKIRIPAFVVVIATFVTIIEMFMKAYAQPIYQSLGIFLPLIVVNCIILARAEAFAFKNGIIPSIIDGLGMGLGYTIALVILGAIREIFGAGTFLGKQLFGANFQPAGILIAPPGAFIVLGLLIGIFNVIRRKKASSEI